MSDFDRPFEIPIDLYDEISRQAQNSGISMEDYIAEAVDRELGRQSSFEAPILRALSKIASLASFIAVAVTIAATQL